MPQFTIAVYQLFQTVQKTLLLLVLSLFLSGCYLLDEMAVAKGYAAKYLCSSVFISQMDPEFVKESIIAPKVKQLPWVWRVEVDYTQKNVYVGDWLLGKSAGALAVYREGKGCTLLVDQSEQEFNELSFIPVSPLPLNPEQPWPYGAGGIDRSELDGMNLTRLEQILDPLFEQEQVKPLNTTAVLVIHKGQLIAERYGLTVDQKTPLVGWSLTKSLTATLVGLLWDEKKLSLDKPVGFTEWQGTAKEAITLRQLLHMSSGLRVEENYSGLSEVTKMLYLSRSQVAHALAQPVVNPPNQEFKYSTAETNRIAALIQRQVGGSQQAMYDFYQRALLHKLGVQNGFIEFDGAGNMVGGAYGYLTARDWARLGLLYLQNGQWQGKPLLSKEWIEFAKQPAPTSNRYGAQLWLNRAGVRWPSVPEDAFMFVGYEGQRIVMLPSQDLLVLRLGVGSDDKQTDTVMEPILKALVDWVTVIENPVK